MIERLAKAHPERAAALLAEGAGTVEHDSTTKPPPNIQAGLLELDEIDIQSQKRSPFLGLIDIGLPVQRAAQTACGNAHPDRAWRPLAA
jgi:hypothetical protein